jgi:1-deoxy-D-xylulose-5-phosphate reductoisomerase
MSGARTLALLGATGSIGASTLDVVARHPGRFRVAALAAHRNAAAMLALCRRFRPRVAALLDRAAAAELAAAVRSEHLPTEVLAGPEGLLAVATHAEADTVLAAIVGAAGLAPTLAAARAGKRILLANKEALVVGGELFMDAVAAGGATLLPIDSEHNAIFQCLPRAHAPDAGATGVRRVILTASGGPFLDTPIEDLEAVTPAEACAHPNWSMGRKISVDSATMMNKGLEVIEAQRLFGVDERAIDVVIHRQSVVHSLVEYVDGSVLAELGNPDMRTPIAQALAYPERIDSGVATLDLVARGRLDFAQPDPARFPCLALARDALRAGGAAPIVLNAANEVAVEAFLSGRLSFTGIARTVADVLAATAATRVATLDDALHCDDGARRATRTLLRLPADSSTLSLAA